MEYYSVLKKNELKRSSTWRDDPALFRWDQCNHKGGRRVRVREGHATTDAEMRERRREI